MKRFTAAGSEGNVLESEERGFFGTDERRFQTGDESFLVRLAVLGRIEIEDAFGCVHIIFTGLIQLFQNVDVIDALAFAEAVVDPGGLDPFFLRIDAQDLFIRVGPVPRPVAVSPDVAPFRELPFAGTVAFIEIAVFQRTQISAVPIFLSAFGITGNVREFALVRPLCQGHRLAVIEQLTVSGNGRPGKPAGTKLAEVGHA